MIIGCSWSVCLRHTRSCGKVCWISQSSLKHESGYWIYCFLDLVHFSQRFSTRQKWIKNGQLPALPRKKQIRSARTNLHSTVFSGDLQEKPAIPKGNMPTIPMRSPGGRRSLPNRSCAVAELPQTSCVGRL